ncbi:LytR/AlgR family response regulator transcription factor [Spirosoma panaciterrae]|uniref:LytR/AlgR family response regulator transcription factor n=1 Tax=Spirosoma panaciterrae TaxID=496058 RepID=UPI000372037C|nr:LytTR family DNA-binding domain-containing protein [Spirosoma panaciterrae]
MPAIAVQTPPAFDPSQVMYLTGDVNYCFIHLKGGEQILSSRTLKWYHQRWPHFIRIHKGYLVNPQYVHRWVVISPVIAYTIMSNGESLSIGRRRIASLSNQFMSPAARVT